MVPAGEFRGKPLRCFVAVVVCCLLCRVGLGRFVALARRNNVSQFMLLYGRARNL